jgi:hypothetical protein
MSFFCACCNKTQSKIAKPNECSKDADESCEVKVCTTCRRHCYGNPETFTCFTCKGLDSSPPCKKQVWTSNVSKRKTKKGLKSVNGAAASSDDPAPAAQSPDMLKHFFTLSETLSKQDSHSAKSLALFHAIAALASWGASELSAVQPPASAPAEDVE